MLYIYGADDINIPTEASGAYFQKLIDEAGKTNIDYHIYEGLGHSLYTPRGFWDGGFVPGYVELVESWAGEQLR